jgi:hypothetical protein
LDAPASALDSKWCSSESDISVNLDENPNKRITEQMDRSEKKNRMQVGIVFEEICWIEEWRLTGGGRGRGEERGAIREETGLTRVLGGRPRRCPSQIFM